LNEVIKNEATYAKGGQRFFDLIFLDLNMPIMDGYEACSEIIKHYKRINGSRFEKQFTKEAKITWLNDLHKVFAAYSAADDASEAHKEVALQNFKKMYKKVVYNALDILDKPFIFAFSAMVDRKVNRFTKECGFDGCFESLTSLLVQKIVKERVLEVADRLIDKNLKSLQKFNLMQKILKEVDICSPFSELDDKSARSHYN